MARDGKSSPFDGSGGKGSGGASYEQANQSRPQPAGPPRAPETVAPGGPLPFTTPNPGRKTGDIAPKSPMKLGG
jgi:hypothetical protein